MVGGTGHEGEILGLKPQEMEFQPLPMPMDEPCAIRTLYGKELYRIFTYIYILGSLYMIIFTFVKVNKDFS